MEPADRRKIEPSRPERSHLRRARATRWARARIWLRRVAERTEGSRAVGIDTLRLEAGDKLRIVRAEVDGEPVDARRGAGELLLPLPPGAADRPGIVVALEYEAPSGGGLRISEEAAFTYFHTDSWLPVPGDLALATKEVEVTVAAEGDRHEAGPVRTGP